MLELQVKGEEEHKTAVELLTEEELWAQQWMKSLPVNWEAPGLTSGTKLLQCDEFSHLGDLQ